jgi:Transposase IS66 family
VPVLDPGRGKTKTGRLWVLVRDERPWGGPAPPAVTYLYSPNRKSEHAQTLLEGCRGFLHADGYAGFNGLYEPDPATGDARLVEVACWAHGRRKLFDVHANTGSAIAKEALERIAALFQIEAEINGRAPDQRRAIRQEHTRPRLADLKDFLERALASLSRKSTLAVAIRYSLSRWPALCRFAHDGRLEMSNNAAERAIRPLALGRNYAQPSIMCSTGLRVSPRGGRRPRQRRWVRLRLRIISAGSRGHSSSSGACHGPRCLRCPTDGQRAATLHQRLLRSFAQRSIQPNLVYSLRGAPDRRRRTVAPHPKVAGDLHLLGFRGG